MARGVAFLIANATLRLFRPGMVELFVQESKGPLLLRVFSGERGDRQLRQAGRPPNKRAPLIPLPLTAPADTARLCLGKHSDRPGAHLLYGCSFLSRRTGCFSPRPLRSRPKTPPIRSTITSKISRIHIMPSGAVTLLWISFSTFQPGDRRSCQFSVFFRFRLFQPPF